MRWRWLAVGFGVLSLGLVVGGVSSARLPPRTYREAVMQVLDERQIAYGEVLIERFCPPSPHCFRTGTVFIDLIADVTVVGTRSAHGQMTCTQRRKGAFWTACTLSLPAFNLRTVPLPPLVSEIPWLVWLERAWRAVQGWWAH